MTIKQQGGVFGRNPTFNNVTVDGALTVDQIVEKTGAAGITLDGVMLKDGNVVLADGKGIDFSATSGTGTSELFDDYEEGTFTPSFGNLTIGDGSVFGRYTKIGRMVSIDLGFRYGSTSSFAGNISGITGLPFSLANVAASSYLIGFGTVFKPGDGWYNIYATLENNAAFFVLIADFSNAAINATSPTTFASGTTFRLSLNYETA